MFERARVNKNWGPLGGIEVIFSCPFISKQIPIEYIWSDGKNFVALSNQYVADGRTLAHIHSMLLRRWEGKEGDTYSKSCDIHNHCLRVVNEYIERDQEMFESPLSGEIGHLRGLPSPEEYQKWRARAGMGKRNNGLSNEVDLDTLFTGDPSVTTGRDGVEEDSDDEADGYL